MDFVTGLPISTNWKGENYESILVIVGRLTKKIHYKLVKVIINVPRLAEIIIDLVVCHHCLPDSIITDKSFLFTSKFWLLLYYFFSMKQKLATTFHLETTSQTKRQNSIMEAYLRAFVNFEQNDWAELLLITKFTYNNVKNVNIGHTSFESSCGYHFQVFYKRNIDPCSKFKLADELLVKLQELMTICCKNIHHAQEF